MEMDSRRMVCEKRKQRNQDHPRLEVCVEFELRIRIFVFCPFDFTNFGDVVFRIQRLRNFGKIRRNVGKQKWKGHCYTVCCETWTKDWVWRFTNEIILNFSFWKCEANFVIVFFFRLCFSGGYVKLLRPNVDQKRFHYKTDYAIWFGPDMGYFFWWTEEINFLH